jgi:TMEM175 potassium channel family protein
MSDSEEQAKQTAYNQIAGRSVERLAAISDGIFAVAMTLLVLDLHNPAHDPIHGEGDFLHALLMMFPQFITYLMSFLTLAIFWNGQQTQLNVFARANRHLTWIHMAFLFAVSVMPFSTRLLSEFIDYRSALLCYWGNVLVLGLVLYWSWRYASHAALIKDRTPPDTGEAVVRRILGAQALYAVGAALCVVNTYVSIAIIVLVQLNFAIAPRIRWLSKI